MIIVDAIYINNGGGKVLLDYLISETEKKYNKIIFLLDKRIINNHNEINNNKKIYINSKGIGRFLFYFRNKNNLQKVFCFGNVPPPLKCSGIVHTYFHQLLFLEHINSISFFQKLTLKLKFSYIFLLRHNTNTWIVQTEYVKNKLQNKLKLDNQEDIFVIPFFKIDKSNNTEKEPNSFLYVSSGAPHKNHTFLINAFVKYFDKHHVGKLFLTVGNENLNLKNYILYLENNGYPIFNCGNLKLHEVKKLYGKCKYFIFPSLSESFGLPILEAYYNDCKIIGINKTYFKEIIKTNYMFDENDSLQLEYILESLLKNYVEIEQLCLVQNKIENLLNYIYE